MSSDLRHALARFESIRARLNYHRKFLDDYRELNQNIVMAICEELGLEWSWTEQWLGLACWYEIHYLGPNGTKKFAIEVFDQRLKAEQPNFEWYRNPTWSFNVHLADPNSIEEFKKYLIESVA